MALNRSFVGRTYPPTEPFEVSRQQIRDFADALGVEDPACHDVAAAIALGRQDLVAPPTLPIVVSMNADEQVVRDPELGLDYTRVVHREQRFIHHRPVVAGQVLTARVTVTGIRSVAGNEILVTSSEVETVEGDPVCSTTTTLVVRGEDGRS